MKKSEDGQMAQGALEHNCKATKTKIAKLQFAEKPRDATNFQAYICHNSVHHAPFLKASVYTWHAPNIHVSESNV